MTADLNTRAGLARAITLIESTRADHRRQARELLASLVAPATPAVRLAISGVPGVGKSTFVETLGLRLVDQGHRVGVLAVDPSSTRTGGSVLGDKTRMPELATRPQAYVRPSPTSGTLGGVARTTAQTIPLLESCGYDVILVETVGVGQSEVHVADMVDTTLLLALAGAGDQLQGIKKGVLEVVDLVAINKADGDHVVAADAAARELTGALHVVHGRNTAPPVLTCSAVTGAGIDRVWEVVLEHRRRLGEPGLLAKRATQQVSLTWALVRDELEHRLTASAPVRAVRQDVDERVRAGQLSAPAAADLILQAFAG